MEQAWVNYGDVNFMEYGGCLVRPHWTKEEVETFPSLNSEYDVLYVDPEMDQEDQIFAALLYVDIDDSWIDLKEVMQAIGLEEKNPRELPPMLLAKEIAEYYRTSCTHISYHSRYPAQFEDYLLSEEELRSWMTQLGAEQYAA